MRRRLVLRFACANLVLNFWRSGFKKGDENGTETGEDFPYFFFQGDNVSQTCQRKHAKFSKKNTERKKLINDF